MAERITMPLWEPVQAHKAFTHLYNTAKPYLIAGHRMVAKLEPENRRENHNRHFHSLIGQISQQLGATVPDIADPDLGGRSMTFRRTTCPHCRAKLAPGQRIHPECISDYATAQADKAQRAKAKKARAAAKVERASIRARKEAIKTIPDL